MRCQESANCSEDKLDDIQCELAEFKAITGCDTLLQLRMWLDSQRGRVVTANALIEGFWKAAPELAAKIIG